jgi:hypothetical protein
MKKNYVLGIGTLALVAILGVSFAAAGGFGFGNGLTDEDRAEKEAQREAIQNSVETGDYATWEGLMQERFAEIEDQINPERFAEIQARHSERAEMREAMQEAKETGDFSKVEELREELGMPAHGKGAGRGKFGGQRKGGCPMAE